MTLVFLLVTMPQSEIELSRRQGLMLCC